MKFLCDVHISNKLENFYTKNHFKALLLYFDFQLNNKQ